MAKMTEILCKCGCGRKKMVRVVDRKRGWGLYYSKSCKAKSQEKRTGQMSAYLRGASIPNTNTEEQSDQLDYTESIARTDKLYCSDCGKKINKGSTVMFELLNGSMKAAVCSNCSTEYSYEMYMSTVHPFSSEGLGQD
jgi:hypothetical protein